MTETPSGAGDPIDPVLRELLEQSPAEEQSVLDQILTSGLDQGWFIRPTNEDLLFPTASDCSALYERLGSREPVRPTAQDPWCDEGPPLVSIDGDTPGWVVLSQRCDLIQSYIQEPLIELARATLLDDAGGAASARSNSPRLVAFCDGPDHRVWAADLRHRSWLPKHRVVLLDAVPAIPTERDRKRFRLRLGQRYWRDPVPDDLVDTLQRPLTKAVRKSAPRVARFANFAMWLGQRAGESVLIAAVAAHGREMEAEEDWGEIMKFLEAKEPSAYALIEPHESGAFSASDIPLSFWLESFKFDFDDLTYGRRAGDDHAEPPH